MTTPPTTTDRRTPEGWRFARRRFWIPYRGSVSLDGTAYPAPPPR